MHGPIRTLLRLGIETSSRGCEALRFTAVESNFIVTFDSKYRLGRDTKPRIPKLSVRDE